MSYRMPLWAVLKPSGQLGPDGTEYYIILEIKLSRASADTAAAKYEGAIVQKYYADKATE